jgi:hypothetical protein
MLAIIFNVVTKVLMASLLYCREKILQVQRDDESNIPLIGNSIANVEPVGGTFNPSARRTP